ncbi:MAG: DUF5069 domain-containing protein [bacterium]|nr:DUF5069 domain-containing protein [bacterium]
MKNHIDRMQTKRISNLDLTKKCPRSPKARLANFVILARMIDKCGASLAGTIGEYEFGCELDRFLLDWKGISVSAFEEYVREGHTEDDVVKWVKSTGIPKADGEIAEWSNKMETYKYDNDEEGREWLNGGIAELGLSPKATLFDYLEADDASSFSK